MSAYLNFYRQVRYDYSIVNELTLCDASSTFDTEWKDKISRDIIKRHGQEYLDDQTIVSFSIGHFSLFNNLIPMERDVCRKIRHDFLNWIVEKLDKQRRELKIQELEHYRETVHPESEECKMTNVQIKILYGHATSDDYYCSPDDEGFYLWEAAIFIEQWIKE